MTTAPMTAPAGLVAVRPAAVDQVSADGVDGPSWLTATVRPAGSFGTADVARLHMLLGALSGSASLVVLDLSSARLRSHEVASAVDEAAGELERRGGCLICVHADDESRTHLSRAGGRTVLLDPRLGADAPVPVGPQGPRAGMPARHLQAVGGPASRRAG